MSAVDKFLMKVSISTNVSNAPSESDNKTSNLAFWISECDLAALSTTTSASENALLMIASLPSV